MHSAVSTIQPPGETVRRGIAFTRPMPTLAEPLAHPINLILAGCISSLILCVFLAVYNGPLDWFLIPIFVCGCLSGIDMVAYFRGQLDIFDPLGVLGAFSYHFFFIAPLMTVAMEYHSRFLPAVPNWTDWIGWMALINTGGLILYLGSRRIFPVRRPTTAWVVRAPSFFTAISIALPIAFCLQAYIFVKFGGITGFMQAFTDRDQAAFSGMGYVFLLAETLPVFLAIAVLVWKREFLKRSPWTFLLLLVFGFFLLKLVCGGLRGSRTITVFGLFWIAGAIHVWIRPVPRRFLAVGVLFIVAFMYLYGFYKDVGIRAFEAVNDTSRINQLEQNSGRTIYEVLLSDLARTEIQATLLHQVVTGDYQFGWGKTYLQDFAFFIPHVVWPDRPEGKVTAGTEALFGRGSYDRVLHRSTYIYGLAGRGDAQLSPHIRAAGLCGSRLRNFPVALVPGGRQRRSSSVVDSGVCLWIGLADGLGPGQSPVRIVEHRSCSAHTHTVLLPAGVPNLSMVVVVTSDFRFTQTPDGQVWTGTSYARPFWDRYLKVFDKVRIVARAEQVNQVAPEFKAVSGDGVEFRGVPFYLGPWQYLKVRGRVREALRSTLGPHDAALFRVSSRLADDQLPLLWKQHRPYGLEVVGDPMESLAPGAVKHPLRPVFRQLSTRALKAQCARASAVSYVTERVLQERYPAGHDGLSISVSDAELQAASFSAVPRVFTTHYSSTDLAPDAYAAKPKMHTGPVPPRLVFVGSLAQMYKGPDVLLNAINILSRQGFELELSLVGGGRHMPQLKQLAQTLGVGRLVTFHGEVPSEAVRERLDWGTLFVLPSRTEGLPRVIVEAMARALPCIASNVGGIPELLHPDDMVASNDAEALAAKIKQVLTSPARLNEMSIRNLAKAQEFRPDVLEERRTRFYRFLYDVTQEWLAAKPMVTT